MLPCLIIDANKVKENSELQAQLRKRQSVDRKKDHIDLAFESATNLAVRDQRFDYEPLLTTHPRPNIPLDQYFLGKRLSYPIWVSSMTGGTAMAKLINRNLARACAEYGLGMGLGSCRKLLTSDTHLEDFAVRPYIEDQPLYANLGIAQVIDLVTEQKLDLITELLKKLEADGLIVHVNPIQEWLQPEGDKIYNLTPLECIKRLLDLDIKIVVKEVGQGMGPRSINELLSLPIAALEFGAFGGTNFAKLEALRDQPNKTIDPICYVGHTPSEMIESILSFSKNRELSCKQFIISGSIRTYLDGYYYNQCLPFNSVYGQAAGFLQHAMGDYELLSDYVDQQTKGYAFAMRYLRLKSGEQTSS